LLERAEVQTPEESKPVRATHNLGSAEYNVRMQDTNKQGQTDKILSVNPPSARDNSIYSITTYPHPWKCC